MKIKTYTLRASNGRKIRKATMVEFENGATYHFVEKLTKAQAERQAMELLLKGRLE